MLICGQKFHFSPLNADDIERTEQAQATLRRNSALEAQRVQQEHCSYAEQIRGQCRLIMTFLDEVLGEGASARLGLTGSDLGQCRDVVEQIKAAIQAEKPLASTTETAAVTHAALVKDKAPPQPEKPAQDSTAARVEKLLANPEARALLGQLAARMTEQSNG